MSNETLKMLNWQIEHTSKAVTDIARGIEQARDQIAISERSLTNQQEHLDTLRALRDVLTSGRLTGSGQYPTVPATPPAPTMPDGPVPHDPGGQALHDRFAAVQVRLDERAELRAQDGTVLARGVLDHVDARCVYLRNLELGQAIVALAEMYALTPLPAHTDSGCWGALPDETRTDGVRAKLFRRAKHTHQTSEDETR